MTANQINLRNVIETERSNRVREEQGFLSIAETTRSNVAREGETLRSNLASESIRSQANAINAVSAAAAATSAAAAVMNANTQATRVEYDYSLGQGQNYINSYRAQTERIGTIPWDQVLDIQRQNANSNSAQASASWLNAVINATESDSRIALNSANALLSNERAASESYLRPITGNLQQSQTYLNDVRRAWTGVGEAFNAIPYAVGGK